MEFGNKKIVWASAWAVASLQSAQDMISLQQVLHAHLQNSTEALCFVPRVTSIVGNVFLAKSAEDINKGILPGLDKLQSELSTFNTETGFKINMNAIKDARKLAQFLADFKHSLFSVDAAFGKIQTGKNLTDDNKAALRWYSFVRDQVTGTKNLGAYYNQVFTLSRKDAPFLVSVFDKEAQSQKQTAQLTQSKDLSLVDWIREQKYNSWLTTYKQSVSAKK